ncbi:MAG TPA: hypothetical protein VFT50_01755 [Baekduia sp.]|nr:hypothetical protein [Baekduia sp.]
MSLFRRMDDSEPQASPNVAGPLEIRRDTRTGIVALGTMACPDCDAPVAPEGGGLSPAAPVSCPFCGRDGAVRDFLSLTTPTRPARVVVRVVHRGRPVIEPS